MGLSTCGALLQTVLAAKSSSRVPNKRVIFHVLWMVVVCRSLATPDLSYDLITLDRVNSKDVFCDVRHGVLDEQFNDVVFQRSSFPSLSYGRKLVTV